jgi:hypothetical protein
MLNVYRLSDGTVLRKISAGARLMPIIAADASSGVVFGSMWVSTDGLQVRQWPVADDTGAAVLEAAGVVVAEAGISKGEYRPLTVVPPVPGKSVSHLVVGSSDDGELLVISLPERRLVHRHTLYRTRVFGLAADPWGRALVVCDVSKMRVLPWPLPGMPDLV